MNRTSIAWTDFSASPVKYRNAAGEIVWACEKVSAGCKNCYAATLAKRWHRGADFNAAEMAKVTPFMDAKECHALRSSLKITGRRVFIEDMSDLYGEWISEDTLNRLYSQTLEMRGDVTFQVLTKRSDRLRRYLNWRYGERPDGGLGIPSRNIWHGVSVGSRDELYRLDDLARTRSAIRFVSFEPLIEDLGDLSKWLPFIQWGIIGAESGASRRACQPEWIANVADQLTAAGVAAFVKQGAHHRPGMPVGVARLDALKEFPRLSGPEGQA